MKHNVALTTASLLSILFMTFHVADDIVRGMEPGTLPNFIWVLTAVVWLYATLVLPERRSGYVILILGSLLGSVVPIVHMRGKGVGAIARSSGGFFFVFTILALGITAIFTLILSARGLWSLRRGEPR